MLEPDNWLDRALRDLTLTRNHYRAYSPYYQWAKWIRE